MSYWSPFVAFGILLIVMNCEEVRSSFGMPWNKIIPNGDEACLPNNVKLLSLLNLLCNTTQTTSIQMRDACYGCFFRAGNQLNGPQKLSSLNDCAKLYSAATEFGQCAVNLEASVASNNRPIVANNPVLSGGSVVNFCYAGYCDFVRCVRRINAQKLISSCYNETFGTRSLTDDQDRIYFYTNITNCILAKTRCSQYNPITGELQQPFPLLSQQQPQQMLPFPAPAAGAIGAQPIVPLLASVPRKRAIDWLNMNNAFRLQAPPPPLLPSGAIFAPYYSTAVQISETGDLRVLNFASGSIRTDEFCSRTATAQQSGYGPYNC